MAKKKENFMDMGGGELTKKLEVLRENLRAIKFKAEGARSKNVKEVSTLKKNIARALTALSANNK
jgi:ribosomal protein L29